VSFIAECPFCGLKLLNVPHGRTGESAECPRCRSLFTLAAMINPPKDLPPIRKRADFGSRARSHASVADASSATAVQAAPFLKSSTSTDAPLLIMAARYSRARAFGAAAVVAGVLAVLSLLLPSTEVATLPLSLAGIALAAGGLYLQGSRIGLGLPVAGLGVSLPGLALALFWPDLLELPFAATDTSRDTTIKAIPLDGNTRKSYTPAAYECVDASKWALQQGDARLTILSLRVAPYQIRDMRGKVQTKEKSLQIHVRVANVSSDHSVTYSPWRDWAGAGGNVFLCDNTGKVYHFKAVSSAQLLGGTPRASLAPGASVDDVLLFDPPGKLVTLFDLELPASAFEGAGRLQIGIPGTMAALH
jgi:hypothetical protein